MGELDEAMCEAIALGERAGKQGDVPVGAVVLDERGTVIGLSLIHISEPTRP